MQQAPGWPGIPPRWTSSAKVGVGTALSPLSRVWFTLSHGILNEVYYPRVDQACIRDFGFLVTDGAGFFSEEKRDTRHAVARSQDGVPSFLLRNVCLQGRYAIEKQVVSDPKRDVVLQSVRLMPNGGKLRLFVLLAPHLVNGGANNTAWVGNYKGIPMLFAEGDGTALALAISVPWLARSAGFVGVSDGWRDICENGHLTDCHTVAADGNVALCGELDVAAAGDRPIVLALGFGRFWSEAAIRVRSSLGDGFPAAQRGYTQGWTEWQNGLHRLDRTARGHNSYRVSTTVLRAHDSPSFPGGIIASLSIPWGATKGDDDLGGYHLVWPRDLAETGGALLACGALEDARRVLDYLRATQEEDGSWPQNNWLDGLPYWRGLQMDECAFPILLFDLARRHGALPEAEVDAYRDMIHRATGVILRSGPITGQDRWEENAGLTPFTLAVEISALLAAADLVEASDPARAALLRDTADSWNAAIEDWTWAADTELARQAGVAGYYMRICPAEGANAIMAVKNRPPDSTLRPAREVISPDALALVRFGLRAPDDPRIRATIQAIDHHLRVELPQGPSWHRYNDDGYGEHEDGSPFDGTGIGRAWPLLTGERGHVALAAGDKAEAERLLVAMETMSSRGGLIPEQVWDADDIPDRELWRGRPSGSAMPLVWAHAEHVKLCRSLSDGAVFDMPPQPVQRYLRDRQAPRCTIWRPDLPAHRLVAGRVLRVDLSGAATLRWTADGWASQTDTATRDAGQGLFLAELPTAGLAAGSVVEFTWQWHNGAWTDANHQVAIIPPA
jgi:glucoamylase